MKNGRKSSNLVKSHELICPFIGRYLVPLLPSGIYRWSIILADTDFFQQSVSVSAANFRGRNNRPSAKHFFHQTLWHFKFDQTLSYSAKVSAHKIPKFDKKKCLADGRLFLPLKSAADTDTDC